MRSCTWGSRGAAVGDGQRRRRGRVWKSGGRGGDLVSSFSDAPGTIGTSSVQSEPPGGSWSSLFCGFSPPSPEFQVYSTPAAPPPHRGPHPGPQASVSAVWLEELCPAQELLNSPRGLLRVTTIPFSFFLTCESLKAFLLILSIMGKTIPIAAEKYLSDEHFSY